MYMLQTRIAEHRDEKKKNIVIYKKRRAPFHIDKFYSDWTDNEPSLSHFIFENRNFTFSVSKLWQF